MLTQAELGDRLRELGIARTERVLTDWREKGLLPPLRNTGLKGGGSKWFWDDGEAAVEQAVAVHCLLTRYSRTSEALLSLWFSGYPVDAELARQAWLQRLERERDRVAAVASRHEDGYLSVGKSLWNALGKPEPIRDFVVGIFQHLFDETERDDAGYRAAVAWLLNAHERSKEEVLSGNEIDRLFSTMLLGDLDDDSELSATEAAERSSVSAAITHCVELIRTAIEAISDEEPTPTGETYRTVDNSWKKFGTETIVINREAIQFVDSMTIEELECARASLVVFRRTIQHCIELTDPCIGKKAAIRAQVTIMGAFGRYLALQLIAIRRRQPEWPMTETISAIHNFVKRVQFADISRQNDNNYHVSEQVNTQWTMARRELARLWEPVSKNK
jgi:hypothetical protein